MESNQEILVAERSSSASDVDDVGGGHGKSSSGDGWQPRWRMLDTTLDDVSYIPCGLHRTQRVWRKYLTMSAGLLAEMNPLCSATAGCPWPTTTPRRAPGPGQRMHRVNELGDRLGWEQSGSRRTVCGRMRTKGLIWRHGADDDPGRGERGPDSLPGLGRHWHLPHPVTPRSFGRSRSTAPALRSPDGLKNGRLR